MTTVNLGTLLSLPKDTLGIRGISSQYLFLFYPWKLVIYFPSLWICLFWTFHINRIIIFGLYINGIIIFGLYDWPVLLSIMFSRCFHVVAYVNTSVFNCWIIFHCLDNNTTFCLPIHHLAGCLGCGLFFTFWLLSVILLRTFVYKFLCTHVFISLRYIPESGIAGSYSNSWTVEEFACLAVDSSHRR